MDKSASAQNAQVFLQGVCAAIGDELDYLPFRRISDWFGSDSVHRVQPLRGPMRLVRANSAKTFIPYDLERNSAVREICSINQTSNSETLLVVVKVKKDLIWYARTIDLEGRMTVFKFNEPFTPNKDCQLIWESVLRWFHESIKNRRAILDRQEALLKDLPERAPQF